LSTKPFSRVVWIILDGMGSEHVRLCLDSDAFPSLARMKAEGYIGATIPSSPVCQTPSALLTLFTGSEPPESGVWGYLMPDPDRLESSLSGFSARPRGVRTLWDELGERGKHFSLMNVAFRNDPVWSTRSEGLDFGYDGYRAWKRPQTYHLPDRPSFLTYGGIRLKASPHREGLTLTKGYAVKARLTVGRGEVVAMTRGTSAYAFLVEKSLLVLSPMPAPMVRGTARLASAERGFLDFDVFRMVRRMNAHRSEERRIPIAVEMAPVETCMRDKEEMTLEAMRSSAASLVIAYFPLVDELNHAYVDQMETEWPTGRASDLFRECARLVDRLLGRVMAEAGPDTLVVVSSDHGSASHRSLLHINDLLARQGLVRRGRDGYDFRRSAAFYHPSDCGLVSVRPGTDRAKAIAGLRRSLEAARIEHGVDIGMIEPTGAHSALAFLFPLGDGYFTGNPPGRGRSAFEWGKAGGHHLSPLSPTPWINAMLGLWASGTGALKDRMSWIPKENREMKRFLLEALGED
jgi:predicted AlkP superfamily pyrophosphatase or phosphodiesterase